MVGLSDSDILIGLWIKPTAWRAVAVMVFITAFIVFVAALVYLTGGTAYAWLNMMYIPIILAAAFYHVPGGALVALVGGFLLGPLMPLNVTHQVPQETSNWVLRCVFFMLVGLVTGALFTVVNLQLNRLREAHKQLAASHLELQKTQLELIQAEKLESVGRLAAGVAHEVKNPLAVLQFGVDFLSTVVQRDDSVSEAIKEMDAAIKKADSVIRGLVDYSRFDTLDLQAQHLNPIVEKALTLVRHEFIKEHIVVETNLSSAIPQVSLDRGKIEQVFINLFLNAVHAMEGGGTLTVITCERLLGEQDLADSKSLLQRFTTGDRAVIVEIRDTGIGIPEDKLDKLFDPFFTTKPVGKGTGLGLSVCQKIIDLHSGSIQIRNRKERGAAVSIFLKPSERSTV